MELDEYKMQTYQRFRSSFQEKSYLELKIILHARVDSVIEKIKRNLRTEIIFALFFVLFTVYLVMNDISPYLNLLALAMFGYCLIFICYLIMLYKKIDAYYATSLPIKKM